eukprot:11805.XXX_519442_518723_1 [CDS] Oithona nana genome sequencing.
MKYTDYNANRIPARITGIYCLKHRIVGKACNNSSKCFQLTAKMDVGYIETNEDNIEIVVKRRNVTIGLGCGCLPKKVRRFHQIMNLPIDL